MSDRDAKKLRREARDAARELFGADLEAMLKNQAVMATRLALAEAVLAGKLKDRLVWLFTGRLRAVVPPKNGNGVTKNA